MASRRRRGGTSDPSELGLGGKKEGGRSTGESRQAVAIDTRVKKKAKTRPRWQVRAQWLGSEWEVGKASIVRLE